MLGPSVMFMGAPVAFLASVYAVKQKRYGIASRIALVLSSLEFLIILGVLWLIFLS
jgi:hypothetical protein